MLQHLIYWITIIFHNILSNSQKQNGSLAVTTLKHDSLNIMYKHSFS